MQKLVVLDVDGVLLDTKIGGFKLLAEAVGKGEEMRKQHAEYEKRKHQGPWGLEQLAMLFAGISETKLNNHAIQIVDSTIMPEAYAVVQELRKRNYLVVAYSSSPSWIMNYLKQKLGLDDICANVLEVKDGNVTGKILQKMDRYGKKKHLLEFMTAHKLTKQDVIVVGDSVSDLPMAQHGTFYAFNTNDAVVVGAARQVIMPPLNNLLKYL
ncbi:MAG: HAD family phosphatase [Candidatus Aenigmarchaeota archaeon]|nr:HAD family phosphatase [Candidatus Aenigmarchaeota archaeon]